jgi:tetratricopeptide (TPR) repeat protein
LLAQARGHFEAARTALDRALALAESNPGNDDLAARALLQRSALELETGRPEAATVDARRALALEQRMAEPGTFSNRIGAAQLALARALRAQGNFPEAQAAFAAGLSHLEPSVGPDHPDTREARQGAASELPGPGR